MLQLNDSNIAQKVNGARFLTGFKSIGLGLLLSSTLLSGRTAQTAQAAEIRQSLLPSGPQVSLQTLAQSNLPTPPNLGAPKGRTGGGASRGACSQYQAIRAISPPSGGRATSEQTTLDHPTFWFYLPERTSNAASLEFVLQDAQDHYVYRTVFTSPSASAGLMSLTVPQQATPLVMGALYNWTLSIQCDPTRPNQVTFVRGRLQKAPITADLKMALQSNPSDVAAQLYAERGFWSDAMTLLAQTFQTQSMRQSSAQFWKSLLMQSGLAEVQPSLFAGKMLPTPPVAAPE